MMAKAAGISRTNISDLVNHERVPGSNVIDSISRLPGVNGMWVRSGVGKRLLSDAPLNSSTAVPLSRRPLPGPLQKHRDLVGTDVVDILSVITESTYWLEISRATAESPGARLLHLRVGDRILLETDRDRFPREELIDDQVCVVVGLPQSGDEGQLVVVRHVQEEGAQQGYLIAETLPRKKPRRYELVLPPDDDDPPTIGKRLSDPRSPRELDTRDGMIHYGQIAAIATGLILRE
jgi:hypothetical protein